MSLMRRGYKIVANDFSRYDKVRKFQDFPPLPPYNFDRPGAGENPLDDQGVKDLIEVINAMGPGFPPEASARYLRELCVECPTNADVFEAVARHEDRRALKRQLALQAEEKIRTQQVAAEALRQERHRRFVEWCKQEGIALPDEPQDRQPDDDTRQQTPLPPPGDTPSVEPPEDVTWTG
jgi:hypothetical protein